MLGGEQGGQGTFEAVACCNGNPLILGLARGGKNNHTGKRLFYCLTKASKKVDTTMPEPVAAEFQADFVQGTGIIGDVIRSSVIAKGEGGIKGGGGTLQGRISIPREWEKSKSTRLQGDTEQPGPKGNPKKSSTGLIMTAGKKAGKDSQDTPISGEVKGNSKLENHNSKKSSHEKLKPTNRP